MKNPLLIILRLTFTPCKLHAELESHACERRLPWAERAGHWGHLRICAACRLYRRHLARMRGAAAKLEADSFDGPGAEEPMPQDVRERLRSRLGR